MNVFAPTPWQAAVLRLRAVFDDARLVMTEREWEELLAFACVLLARLEAERIDQEERAA